MCVCARVCVTISYAEWGKRVYSFDPCNYVLGVICFQETKKESEVAQYCPTLCDPMDCSLLGSSVHGIFQVRILEWVAISCSRRSSWPRDWTRVSCIIGRCFTNWATREVSRNKAQQRNHKTTKGRTLAIKPQDSLMIWGQGGLMASWGSEPGSTWPSRVNRSRTDKWINMSAAYWVLVSLSWSTLTVWGTA